MMRKWMVVAAILAMALGLVVGANAEDELKLVGGEAGDTVTVSGGEVSAEQAKSGKGSVKWADHMTHKSLVLRGYPTDWSAYNKVAFWLYSEKANGAEFVFLVFSENPKSEGIDYWQTEIKVDWTGWKYFEFPFYKLRKSRKPLGWGHITSVQFNTSGWGNEPKEDTLLYLDDMTLFKMSMEPKNTGFEAGEGNNGVPLHWEASPPITSADVSLSVVDGGRTGKALKIVDHDKKNGVGVRQTVPAEAGKTYKVSLWKKGAMVGVYLKWLDGGFKDNGLKNMGAKNQDPAEFEQFELTEQAPEGTKFVQPWIYSYTSNEGEIVVDDVKIEEVK